MTNLIDILGGAPHAHTSRATPAATMAAVQELSPAEAIRFLEGLCRIDPPRDGPRLQLLDDALSPLGELARRLDERSAAELAVAAARLYEHLGPQCSARRRLLQALAGAPAAAALDAFARLFCEDPPAESLDANASLAPLFQHPRPDAARLFPRLLGALEHPSAAPAVLDLANFLVRSGSVTAHPAAGQAQRLMGLLGGVVSRLEKLQNRHGEAGDIQERQRQIGEGVALSSSLCDALGLIGDRRAIPVLRDAAALAHRRIRLEAAAALARLGDGEGMKLLAAMAEHPVTRLRAISYAEELELSDHLDPALLQPQARAEAQLACWLSEPTQLGAPPTAIEAIDSRTQFWPGFDEPQECFLFRFAYQTPDAVYENIGIAGPLVRAFHVDLRGLPLDDIYAAFAGWQAEHPDIHEISADDFSPAQEAAAARLARRLSEEGFSDVRPALLGAFFGEAVLVALARREDRMGAVVAGSDEAAWFPHDGSTPRPLGPREAWCIWKGRLLLRTFNG